jgi:hypothetical protein
VTALPATTVRALYRERAHLLAFIAATPDITGVLSYSDPRQPEYAVLTLDTEAGQLTWHIHPDDLDRFPHVPLVDPALAPAWDGHTTAEKNARLTQLTRRDAPPPCIRCPRCTQ